MFNFSWRSPLSFFYETKCKLYRRDYKWIRTPEQRATFFCHEPRACPHASNFVELALLPSRAAHLQHWSCVLCGFYGNARAVRADSGYMLYVTVRLKYDGEAPTQWLNLGGMLTGFFVEKNPKIFLSTFRAQLFGACSYGESRHRRRSAASS